jgi:hypothetical protein
MPSSDHRRSSSVTRAAAKPEDRKGERLASRLLRVIPDRLQTEHRINVLAPFLERTCIGAAAHVSAAKKGRFLLAPDPSARRRQRHGYDDSNNEPKSNQSIHNATMVEKSRRGNMVVIARG